MRAWEVARVRGGRSQADSPEAITQLRGSAHRQEPAEEGGGLGEHPSLMKYIYIILFVVVVTDTQPP